MRNFRRAKMTAKARDAVATYAAHHNISISDVRTDRPAIRGIYAELEGLGYQWIAAKQSWAYTQVKDQEHKVAWTMAVDADAIGEVLYLLEESLKASGYKLLCSEPMVTFDGVKEVVVIGAEIKA